MSLNTSARSTGVLALAGLFFWGVLGENQAVTFKSSA